MYFLSKNKLILEIIPVLSILMITGCTSATNISQQQLTAIYTLSPTTVRPTISPTAIPEKVETKDFGSPPTLEITSAPTIQVTPTIRPTLGPDEWQELLIIPEIGDRVIEIYKRGIELGNNPNSFSKVGDCGTTPSWFLGDFDRGPEYYELGDYTNLLPIIDHYQGAYGRTSLAAKSGFNASSIFSPIWSDRAQCQANETPLECEYRISNPAIAIIMLGSNDVWHRDAFEQQMRKIIEYTISEGIVPILSTKADNDEKDGSINATIAELALGYEIPLLNYWRAVQPLPDHGLQEDGVHITWGPNRFNDPQIMKKGWPVRNLVTLQILDAVWQRTQSYEQTR
jgi:hypothetical protein